jgi:glycosyltransferase involved in cell wall biosynthesis
MPVIYRVGDALIMNSKSETWGLAINEALACGVPVIVSDKCGGAIDLIDTSNGIIINKATDSDHLTQWVNSFNKDENTFYNSMKVHSYQTIIDFVISQIQ